MNNEQIITAYAYLTIARIYKKRGKWILDTPDFTEQFDTMDNLLSFVRDDLEIMKECIEPELWEEAKAYATR
jgi:hypothetical protein